MKQTIIPIGERIELISVHEPKFKTNTLAVQLLVPLQPEKNSAYSLAFSMLTQSCRKYPDNIAMTVRLDDLYGASLNASSGVNGVGMTLMLYGSVIANRYALSGEDLLGELTELVLDCLLDPNAKDGAFDASEFAIEKKELLDTIQSEINNKRGYAMLRSRRTLFAGEPDAGTVYGTREEAEQLDPENTFAAYQELLRRAVIRVYFVGPDETPETEARLRKALSALPDRAPEDVRFALPSPIKPEAVHVTEQMDCSQCQLILGFKYEEQDSYAVRMFNVMFGAAPFSALFMNVREKLSLCYYCSSSAMSLRNTVTVNAGVEAANVQKTYEAIHAQLDAFRRGEFSDELLENAKRILADALRSIGDTPYSCIMEAYERYYSGDPRDVEARIARFLEVTREDVIAVANALREDTVYLMQQEEAEHEQN